MENKNSVFNYKGHIPKIHESVFVAPTAAIIGEVEIEENSSIWFHCVLRADIAAIKIGKNTNIQDGSIIHVDYNVPCIIGDNVTVGHNAILHACVVEKNSRIGMGAIVLNGARVEEDAQVGAGAVVPPGKVVTKGSLWVGIPAQKIKDNDEAALAHIHKNATAYVELSKSFKEAFK